MEWVCEKHIRKLLNLIGINTPSYFTIVAYPRELVYHFLNMVATIRTEAICRGLRTHVAEEWGFGTCRDVAIYGLGYEIDLATGNGAGLVLWYDTEERRFYADTFIQLNICGRVHRIFLMETYWIFNPWIVHVGKCLNKFGDVRLVECPEGRRFLVYELDQAVLNHVITVIRQDRALLDLLKLIVQILKRRGLAKAPRRRRVRFVQCKNVIVNGFIKTRRVLCFVSPRKV